MPYDPYEGVYEYIDKQLNVRHQTTGHRPKQPLPSRDIIAAAQRQAEIEARARQRNTRTNTAQPSHTRPGGRQDEVLDVDEEQIDGEGDVWPPQLPTSTRRYNLPPEGVYQTGNTRVHVQYLDIPPRRSAQPRLSPAPQPQRDTHTEQRTQRPPGSKQKTRWHPVLWFGLGLVAMFVLYVVLSNLVYWWQIQRDDWAYQRPRTFQIDAVVGHNDSPSNPSHFIVINLNRHVEIIEIPGGDTSKMRVYDGPVLFGQGQDLTPVTLSFKDVNGDGKPDMLIHVRDQPQEQIFVMINENGTFRAQKPGEQIHF